MIAFVKEHKLSDGSSVFDVQIEESGVTMVALPCVSHQSAMMLLAAIGVTTNVKVIL